MLKTKLTKTILKTTDNYIKWLEKAGILTIWLEHREYLIQKVMLFCVVMIITLNIYFEMQEQKI